MDGITQKNLTTKIGYWLVPESSSRDTIQQVIDDLAGSHSGPTFVPHITIYVGAESSARPPLNVLQRASKEIAPLTLEPTELLFTEKFTKSCFLQFDRNEDLIKISSVLLSKISASDPYEFNPHMSLFYGALNQNQQRVILENVDLPNEIYFTELWAIRSFKHTETAKDVQSWEIVGKEKLNIRGITKLMS